MKFDFGLRRSRARLLAMTLQFGFWWYIVPYLTVHVWTACESVTSPSLSTGANFVPISPQVAPELLAPAGGLDALVAAVANGADAVYLGVDRLNARRGAENFTLENLAEVCRYAHVRGVRVYLTVNVVILPTEVDDALRLVDEAWCAGVDAVIVQDLGLLRVIRLALPDVRVHASTQINAHNTLTVQALANLGVARVTLAREVALGEVSGFVSAGVAEIESFAHGALCVCYSGQCLMSSLIGGRSANRGQCAQPCRMTYELVDAEGAEKATPGAHLLSPKDLAAITVLPQLVEAGVAALKLEGRMKNPEYVALVTGVYRAALDRALSGPDDYAVRDGEMAVLSESFSRGFTEAYLLGERGNDMMSYSRPNNRGVFVGRVVAASANTATVALESQLDAEDTVEFWTSSGRFAQRAGALEFGGAEHSSAPSGVKATVGTERSASAGDRVFRVRNAALASAARRTFEHRDEAAPVELDFAVRLVSDRPLQVEVRDTRGRVGRAEGPVVEPARTKAITAEETAEHIGRLGGTPYRIGAFELELSPGVGVGFSALHRARREALEAYERAVLAPWGGRVRVGPKVPGPGRRATVRGMPAIVAEADDLDVARACLQAGAHRVHVPAHMLSASDLPPGVVPLVPRVLHDREAAAALRFVAAGRTIAAGNLGALAQAAEHGSKVEAHWSLNALNAHAVAQLAELGAGLVWLSPELSGTQIAAVCSEAPVPVGVSVWGRQEVMVTEHCVLMAEGDCDRRCGACERRREGRSLRDRKGYEFPVRTDVTGRTHLYNSVRLDLLSTLAEIVDAGVTAIRLDVHTEDATSAAEAVTRATRALEAVAAGKALPERPRVGTTSGHYFRGVQ